MATDKLGEQTPKGKYLAVEGHCIAVDSYFIVSDYRMKLKIIGKA